MTKTSQRFASESVKLSQQAQELRRVCAILKPKPSEADKGLIPQWEEEAQLAEGVSQVCTSLVTLFAGVTLLRSPMAGTKADEGKKDVQVHRWVVEEGAAGRFAEDPCHDHFAR